MQKYPVLSEVDKIILESILEKEERKHRSNLIIIDEYSILEKEKKKKPYYRCKERW